MSSLNSNNLESNKYLTQYSNQVSVYAVIIFHFMRCGDNIFYVNNIESLVHFYGQKWP